MRIPDMFCDLAEFLPSAQFDIKYSTADNFTGRVVDGYLANRAIGTRALTEALVNVQHAAHALGLELLIWDVYRPQRAVDCFHRWSEQPEDMLTKAAHYPNIDKTQLFELGYIALKSGHSRGSTVDLTLIAPPATPLDMGTCFDFMDELSRHDQPGISPAQTNNRNLLRSLMTNAGFTAYANEWWHYSLKNEPFTNIFDFPIESPDNVD